MAGWMSGRAVLWAVFRMGSVLIDRSILAMPHRGRQYRKVYALSSLHHDGLVASTSLIQLLRNSMRATLAGPVATPCRVYSSIILILIRTLQFACPSHSNPLCNLGVIINDDTSTTTEPLFVRSTSLYARSLSKPISNPPFVALSIRRRSRSSYQTNYTMPTKMETNDE